LYIIYCGTFKTTCGRKSVDISIANNTLLPKNLNLPKPYAVKVDETIVNITAGIKYEKGF